MLRSRNILRSASSFFLIFEFFAVSALPASAGLFGGGGGIRMPSPSQIAAELENRYHLNLGSIQNQGEGFNVASTKVSTPEVSFFFSPSDPKPGEKFSTKALPIYFSSPEESLYFSWYLKRQNCDSSNCDYNTDGRYNEADWKIEAARILAQNGYDKTVNGESYASDDDNDGYNARFGGDNKLGTPDYCYVHDPGSGINYEVADAGSSTSFGCSSGTAVCMAGADVVNPTTTSFLSGDGTITTFTMTEDSVIAYPVCSGTDVVCSTGVPCCVNNPSTATSCDAPISSCEAATTSSAVNMCAHLFAQPSAGTTGDGSFGVTEERFWSTDPHDPSTATNGKKDEANVVGLGLSTFTWNYAPGDKVGVAVEGTSMIPTKHSNSSLMVMWAFPKNQCYPSLVGVSTGAYAKNIKGYNVTIPTAKMDLNECIKYNLVDPTEGGQSTNLEVGVTATPDNPVNDETTDKGGDTVVALASVNNAQHNVTDILFDWKVEIGKDIANFDADKLDITAKLREWGLMGNTRGNALDTLRLKLDIPSDLGGGEKLSDYLNSSGVGYLRFKTTVTENFSGSAIRKGKSDVIVKFTSTGRKISAYRAGTMLAGGAMKVKLPGGSGLICNDNALDRAACRVIKNEIIGLKIDPAGLSNFYWTVNGTPLVCSYAKVSTDCTDGAQNEVNFFPVVGNPGDTYTVTVTGSDVNTGNVLTLTRTFGVVTPAVAIESLDKNIVWPKLLGQYRDITGKVVACPGGLCNDYSTTMFEAFPESLLGFRAVFIPGFLGGISKREWAVDGEAVTESIPREISFTADKPVGGIYNIELTAQVKQEDETRRALLDIWGISPFESPEIIFSASNQVKLEEPSLAEGPQNGARRYLAAIVSYVPASLLFTLRIFLSAGLALFALSILYSFLEERRVKAFVEGFSRE